MQGAPARLVARRFDGWLVGWLAVGLWLVNFVAVKAGMDPAWNLSTIFWMGAAVSAAHFGLSYHLAYGEGVRAAVRRHPVALGAGPLVIAMVLAVPVGWSLVAGERAAAGVTRAMITTVYLFTIWHYVKQVYGVARVGAAFGGIKLSRSETRALRYGLYPMWWLGASLVLLKGGRNILAGYVYGYGLLPRSVVHDLRLLAWAGAAAVAMAIVTSSRRAGRWPSSVFVAPYAAALLWLSLPTSPLLLVALLAPMHGLQYLAVGHRAEVALAAAKPGVHGVVWWLNLFGGATAGGLLLSRWLPQLLDSQLSVNQGPLLFAATAFVFLNLHHYLIDAVIWRSNGELVKAVVRGPAAVPAPREPLPTLAGGDLLPQPAVG